MVAATFLIKQTISPSFFSKFNFFLCLCSGRGLRPPQKPSHPSRSLAHKTYMDPKSQPVKPTSDSDKAKKKSAVQIFKVGLFMLRRRSKKTKEPVDMGPNKGRWRRLLGSMRPLHVQGNESSPTAAGVNMSLAPSRPKEDFEELPMPLPSASPSSSSSFSRVSKTSRSSSFSRASRTSTSSSFGTSQYASANNLQELYNHNDDSDDENAIEDDNGGDEMIDAKAEEFISQFYEQMRRQHHN